MGHAHAQRGAADKGTNVGTQAGRRIRDDRQVQCVAAQRFSKFMQALTGQEQQRRLPLRSTCYAAQRVLCTYELLLSFPLCLSMI